MACVLRNERLQVTGPLSDYQIEQVYGNAGYGGYGGGGTAYMLFYRRVEPDVNIVDVNASHVPRAGLTHLHSWHPPWRIQLEHAADTAWGVGWQCWMRSTAGRWRRRRPRR